MSSPKKKLTVAIVGGGTGGHITPALAVAEELVKRNVEVLFIGSTNGPEKQIVRDAGYRYYGVQSGKLRRYFAWLNIIDAIRVGIGLIQSWILLQRLRPEVVFTKGGYVTVPVAYSASFLEIPIVAHETDVVMGLANRLVAPKATLVCTGFPINAYPKHLQPKLRYTGNPIRPQFLKPLPAQAKVAASLGFAVSRQTLLVMGGSQGALRINELIWESLLDLLEEYQVIHLTGADHIKTADQKKLELGQRLAKRYMPFGYVGDEFIGFLGFADLVISRAGGSLAELSFLKKPTILIPLSIAASDHQRANARVFRRKDAVVYLEETQLTSHTLVKAVEQLMKDGKERQRLSRAIGLFSSPDAAAMIAEVIMAAPKR